MCAGVFNANSGKTAASAVEIASAATRIPLTAADGSKIPYNYPSHPLIIWVIGKDEKHIGQTLYRQLFQRDQFRTVQDENGVWHAWDPGMRRCADCCQWLVPGVDHLNCDDEMIANALEIADPWLTENKSEPLIPPRMIDHNHWVWNKASANVPEKCQLKNGNVIYFFSSTADPKMGDPVDLIWIDEDIRFPGHVAEWQARLSDRKGRLIWSAYPYDKNPALADMSDRAADQVDMDDPITVEFVLTLPDNPYIDDSEKAKRRAGWSEAEWRARGMGEWVKDLVAVYPSFDAKSIHSTPGRLDDPIDQLMVKTSGEPPVDWTHYLVLDPGHAKPGVILAAVPPPEEFGNSVVVYDELAEQQISADELATLMKPKMEGRGFYAFIIDKRYGRQTTTSGLTNREIYTRAFEKAGLKSAISGNSFLYGSDNVEGGLGAVRECMRVRPESEANKLDRNSPRLRFVKHRTVQTQKQLERYRQSINPSTREVMDKPAPGQKDDLADCIRYLCAYDPEYINPEEITTSISPAFRAFQELKGRMGQREDGSVLMGVVD